MDKSGGFIEKFLGVFRFLKRPETLRHFPLLVFALFLVVLFYAYSSLILDIVLKDILNGQSVLNFVPLARNTLLLLVGTWIFLKVTRYFISRYLENKGKKKEIKLILTLYTYIVWALMFILIASTLFRDIGIFVASLGLIGFGLTFALQKPILNFVGWLTIVVNKPFNMGDRIEVSGVRGDVVAINTMYTSLQGTRPRTHERSEKIISVPNEFVLTNPILNYTKRVDLFWDEITFTITYESNWKKAERIAYDIAAEAVKKYVVLPVVSVKKDKKSFEDALKLLEAASKKLSKGVIKENIKENIETMKTIEQQSKEELPSPNIRVSLGASSIDLNVLYLADIRKIRTMRSEISRNFLIETEKNKDISLAYPHMQVIFDPRNAAQAVRSKKVTDFFPPDLE